MNSLSKEHLLSIFSVSTLIAIGSDISHELDQIVLLFLDNLVPFLNINNMHLIICIYMFLNTFYA